MEHRKIASNKVLWIFAIGQLGWSTLSGIVTNLLVFFYRPGQEALNDGQTLFITKSTFLGLTVIGLISAVGRIFDAVTDPFIAGKSDSLRHKLGRRIPFMRYSAIPFGIVTILLFISPVNGVSTVNSAVLFVCALLFYLCMTCYCTPYNALIPELGRTQNARINLSTFISVTYFFGTALAYVIPVAAGALKSSLGYANSYRVSIAVLAVFAVICMLIPAFLIDENEYADTTPTKASAFSSLTATFRNREFRTFVASDILYWLALTLFQTGLLYYVTELMGLKESMSTVLFITMSVVSLCFYPVVNIASKKLGKKKPVAFAFMFFSATFLITAFAGKIGIPGLAYGIIIAVLAALPMAILGILPQAVVADISEADKLDTGENRQGMFYAARTFAFKLGQSLGLIIFTSVSSISESTGLGYRLTAVIATVLCISGGLVFLRYNEKKVIDRIKQGEEEELNA
ncbi:MAG: MFS transporter [Ruminococcus sp.]|nr:MFS transporter [Ruminococcus sp.]